VHPKTSAHIGLMSRAFGNIPQYLFMIKFLILSRFVHGRRSRLQPGNSCS